MNNEKKFDDKFEDVPEDDMEKLHRIFSTPKAFKEPKAQEPIDPVLKQKIKSILIPLIISFCIFIAGSITFFILVVFDAHIIFLLIDFIFTVIYLVYGIYLEIKYKKHFKPLYLLYKGKVFSLLQKPSLKLALYIIIMVFISVILVFSLIGIDPLILIIIIIVSVLYIYFEEDEIE
ncbi:MAG: hypothetical protein ACTSUL_08755 [Promethearchaeota archaeon]